MEITDELICKIMGGYANQPIAICEPGIEPVGHYLEGVDFVTNQIIAERVHYDPKWIKLILKPLRKITEEDAKVCAQIIMGVKDVDDSMVIKIRNRLQDETFSKAIYSMNYAVRVVQYLQSAGYDLPHYLLGNQTLIKAGLAIDPH